MNKDSGIRKKIEEKKEINNNIIVFCLETTSFWDQKISVFYANSGVT